MCRQLQLPPATVRLTTTTKAGPRHALRYYHLLLLLYGTLKQQIAISFRDISQYFSEVTRLIHHVCCTAKVHFINLKGSFQPVADRLVLFVCGGNATVRALDLRTRVACLTPSCSVFKYGNNSGQVVHTLAQNTSPIYCTSINPLGPCALPTLKY